MKALRLGAALAIALAGLAALAAPAQAQTQTTFVSNFGQAGTESNTIDTGDAVHVAQQFTTGTAAGGYRLAEITIDVLEGTSAAASFAIHASNASGEPGSKVVDLNGSIATAGQKSLTPASTTVLSASTKYFFVIQLGAVTTEEITIKIVESNDEDTGAAAGWSIADTTLWRRPGGAWVAGALSRHSVKIAVKGTLDMVHLPTNVSAAANVPLSIDISWTAPTTTPSRLAVDISRNGRDWSTQRCTHYVINCRVWLSASATSYTHTAHLGGGSTRHYRIVADHSGTATDGHSLAVSATTSSNPRAFAARAGGTTGETTIDVSWTRLATLGADAVTGYGIEVSTDEGETWQTLVADTGSTATSYAHGSLSRGALRHYRVRAIAGTRMSGFGRSAWARTTPNDPGKPVLTLTRLRNPGGIIVWRDREGGILLPVLHELSWPRPDDGGEGELRLTYQFAWDGHATTGKVYRNDQGHDAIELFAQSDTALSFRVRARNEVGENCSVTESCSGAGPWSDPPSTIENAGKAINRANARALLGRFSGVPGRHDGSTRFRFELRFDQEPEDLSYRTVRDGLLTVNGGSVVQARRVKRNSNLRWEVTVQPAGMEDVSITLPVRECSDANAVCAKGEPLAEEVTTTVPIKPFTGSFSGVPAEHAGSGTFTMEFHLSEAPRGLGWRVVRDHLFEVSGGTIARARRIGAVRNKAWELTVAPSGKGDVTLTSLATASCDDANAVCTSDGRMLEGGATATVKGPATFSVADASVDEAAGATLDFVVTLSRSRATAATVNYATSDGTAVAGSDYTATSGKLTFAAGTTSKTVKVAVLDDSHDEGNETMTFTLSNPVGAVLDDDEATGTIKNTDAMPQAWIARFGRTVAEQVVDAVEGRLEAPRTAGLEASFAGQPLGGAGPVADADDAWERREAEDAMTALAEWLGGEGAEEREGVGFESRAVSGREVLLGSSFALTGGSAETGFGALWGRTAVSGFDGRAGDLEVDGEVTSALLGADWSRGGATAGLAVAHSRGEGSYRSPGGDGEAESTLTGVYPYGRYALNRTVSLWGVAGLGRGTLTLEPEGGARIETDLELAMGAVGLRGVLVEAPAEGGMELAAKTDGMVVRTGSEAARGADGGNMAASEADVTRLRLGLQATWHGMDAGGGVLTPMMEVGVRHDGGDAETGYGADIGAGLSWSDPARGLSADVRARTLLMHEAEGFEERGFSGTLSWDPEPETALGPSLTLSQTVGAASSGGAEALLGRRHLDGLVPGDDGDDLEQRSLEAKIGYGFALFGGGYAGTPELGLGLTDAHREMSLGWRLAEVRTAGLAFGLDVEGARRESTIGEAAPEHRLGLGLGWRLEGAQIGTFELRFEGARLDAANDDAEHRIGVTLTTRW